MKSHFYLFFSRSNLFSCERFRRTFRKSQFYLSFRRSNLISCERVALGQVQMKITILPLSFWRLNLISCERVATGPFANRNFNSVFGDRTSFRAKGLAGRFTNCNFTTVFGDRASFRAKGLRRTLFAQIAILPQSFAIEPRFVRKGCPRTSVKENRNFTAVFGDRTSFRAKGCVSNRLVGTAPRLQERNRRRREQEGKRARGQERM